VRKVSYCNYFIFITSSLFAVSKVFAMFSYRILSYAKEIASTGHTSTQAPHSTHDSASATATPSAIAIASKEQTSTQEVHPVHLALSICIAIILPSISFKFSYTFFEGQRMGAFSHAYTQPSHPDALTSAVSLTRIASTSPVLRISYSSRVSQRGQPFPSVRPTRPSYRPFAP